MYVLLVVLHLFQDLGLLAHVFKLLVQIPRTLFLNFCHFLTSSSIVIYFILKVPIWSHIGAVYTTRGWHQKYEKENFFIQKYISIDMMR